MRPAKDYGDIGRTTQSGIYRRGVYGHRPVVPTSPQALETAAARKMSRKAAAYVIGSAGSEDTARVNRESFGRYRIVPRMLTDVSTRDLSIELFGRKLPSPFLVAPVGVLEMVNRDADVAATQVAANLGMPMIMSNQASRSMEICAQAAPSGAPRWFQLYWSSNDELVASLVSRAEAAGCEAIVVTVDTHMLGWRPRDLDIGYLPFARGMGIAQYTSDPVFNRLVHDRAAAASPGSTQRVTLTALRSLAAMCRHYPGSFWRNIRSGLPRAAVDTFLEVFSRSSLTWRDLAVLRSHTKLPIIVKGILSHHDAAKAIEFGADGIMVSNHGGRQVDGAIPALDALPGIVRVVDGSRPVLFDSGIRGGADAFKALALGANAVGVGRPYVYGLSVAGRSGMEAVLSNMLAEFDLIMGLSGCRNISDISDEMLEMSDRT